jgi:hypothetical protein
LLYLRPLDFFLELLDRDLLPELDLRLELDLVTIPFKSPLSPK